jgi:gas vesicle protein
MITRQSELDDIELGRARRGTGAGTVLTSTLIAAAVGAGVALLLAPDSGRNTRKRLRKRFDDLELGKQARSLRDSITEEAIDRFDSIADRWEDLQDRLEAQVGIKRRSAGREAGIGALSTLLGAGIALLLAPETGQVTRDKLSETIRNFRADASTRWRPHRTGDARPSGSGSVEGGNGDIGEGERRTRTPVRTVQELGREDEEVGF